MVDHNLIITPCSGGWCIAERTSEGFKQISYPWKSKEQAEAFLAIARPDLGFIPSALPTAP